MEPDNQETVAISGTDFQGKMQLKNNTLELDVVDFKSGTVYNLHLNDHVLGMEFKRYHFFKNVKKLFMELKDNERLEISD